MQIDTGYHAQSAELLAQMNTRHVESAAEREPDSDSDDRGAKMQMAQNSVGTQFPDYMATQVNMMA